MEAPFDEPVGYPPSLIKLDHTYRTCPESAADANMPHLVPTSPYSDVSMGSTCPRGVPTPIFEDDIEQTYVYSFHEPLSPSEFPDFPFGQDFLSPRNETRHTEHQHRHILDYPTKRERLKYSLRRQSPGLVELSGLSDVAETDGATHSRAVPIKAEPKEQFDKHGSQMYPIYSSPQSHCLIINNCNFSDMPPRRGTHVDSDNISKEFGRRGYEIHLYSDLTAEQMVEEWRHFAQRKSHGSSLVVFVLSHGINGLLIGVDEKAVSVEHLFMQFDEAHAPHLVGTPKLFFLQACRDDGPEFGVDGIPKEHHPSHSAPIEEEQQVVPEISNKIFPGARKQAELNLRSLPAQPDIFVAYATTPHKPAFRNTENGSWFIQAICKVFSQHAEEKDICDLMTLVNSCVWENQQKQIPEFTSRLRKKFYLFAGVTRQ